MNIKELIEMLMYIPLLLVGAGVVLMWAYYAGYFLAFCVGGFLAMYLGLSDIACVGMALLFLMGSIPLWLKFLVLCEKKF